MFQIFLLSALILMLSQAPVFASAISYGIINAAVHYFSGTPIFTIKIWPVLLMKTVFVYIFFRILDALDREPGWWWLAFFISMPLLFICDRWLGLPLLPGYSGIPFVDTPF